MRSNILLLCPFGLDAGLLSRAASLAEHVDVLLPEEDREKAAEYGAERIRVIHPNTVMTESCLATFLAEKIPLWGNRIILAPGTVRMRNLMPQLAFKLNAGLTADCTELSLSGEKLVQVRPAFGNSLLATVCTESVIQMATVRPGTFPAVKKKATAPEYFEEVYEETDQTIETIASSPLPLTKPLSQSDIIVAGGMGVGSKEGFKKLAKLAEKMGGALGASRTAVDAGFAPFCCQIGMTGVTVSPKLYLAVGISGAVQHLAGMSGAEKIIAINSDPKAPIFDYADYGLVGDWEEIIDQILEEQL